MNVRYKNYFYYIFVGCLLCTGCDSVGDCFEGTGKITTDSRYPGNFTSILVEDDINVKLIQNTAFQVELMAGTNLIDEINTYVSDNTLHLENNNVCKWARSYEYEINSSIYFNSLNQIIYKGSGEITSPDTLFLSNPEIIMQGGNGNMYLKVKARKIIARGKSGAGDVLLTGHTDTLHVDVRHAGLFDFSGLKANVVTVHQGGTNNILVHSTNELHVNITYIGNVLYEGDPVVLKLKKTGEGQLIKK